MLNHGVVIVFGSSDVVSNLTFLHLLFRHGNLLVRSLKIITSCVNSLFNNRFKSVSQMKKVISLDLLATSHPEMKWHPSLIGARSEPQRSPIKSPFDSGKGLQNRKFLFL